MAPSGAPLAECVPNFSEGRNAEVIARLRAAVAAVERVKLLDCHSDPDHNRTVLTFAGPLPQLSLAAMRVGRAAVEFIDMRGHDGAHPRMGSVDVVPFVPLRGASLTECASAAREVARYLGQDLGVPAFLYGAAAGPNRPRLNQIRGHGHQSVEAMGAAFRPPDFGPPAPHPTAGAVAVGARLPLVAFNVMLNSFDLVLADRIARALRESSGGLPQVQALAFLLPSRGQAQVSMNLLDFRVTGLGAVLKRVREVATKEGVGLYGCELVGLLPEEALRGIEGETLPGVPSAQDSIEARLDQPGLA